MQDVRLLLAVLAPLAGAGLVMATGKRPNVREACSFLAAVTTFGLIASFLPAVLQGETLRYTLFDLLPGLSIALRADALSMIFAVVASFLWILTIFYAAGYMRAHAEPNQTRFNTCFAIAIFGAVGCAFADNLLTLYLFYEIVSICTYPLVAHNQDAESYEGARKYITYLTTTAKGLILPAMVLIYVLSGTLDFATDVHTGILPATTHNGVIIALYVCCLLGFAKNGIMPLHNWLPSAMVAPTPVSALLHAVAVVKVGVFSTVRVMLHVFGVDTMDRLNLGLPTAYFVAFTILVGSIIALSKDNLKARLAYSTVSQLSYIILGVALLTPAAIQGGLFHIAAHAFGKITLFFCAGAIFIASHKKNISEMSGLGRAMPFTFGAFAIASLSMIGAPPVGGFMSKLYLLVGALDAHALGIVLILITSTLLNAAYFMPVVYQGFFGKPEVPAKAGAVAECTAGVSRHSAHAGHRTAEAPLYGIETEHAEAPATAPAHGHDAPHGEAHEAPLVMVVPLCITAALSVLLGFFPDVFLKLAQAVVN